MYETNATIATIVDNKLTDFNNFLQTFKTSSKLFLATILENSGKIAWPIASVICAIIAPAFTNKLYTPNVSIPKNLLIIKLTA